MKKNSQKLKYLFLSIVLLIGINIRSQVGCGQDIVKNIQKNNIANYDELEKLNNIQIKNYIDTHFGNNNSNKVTAGGNYVIPVVFHVVYPVGQAYGTGNNISYSQIQSQIAALNAAFAKNYPAYNGQTHPSYAQNTNIQFCLAKIPMPAAPGFYIGPSGVENGVMRYADNVLTNHQMTNVSATALLGLTHPTASYFPFVSYLNIWVVSSIGGGGGGTIMGYAPKPLMGAYPLDGVVMRSDIIGDNTTGNNFVLGFNLAQGKILAHEVGHYLNLMHIFEGGCAGLNAAGAVSDACDLNGDMICDIEPCTTQNISCTQPIPNTCTATYTTGTTNLDMINSYMSYADDDCMNTFTNNQAQRMQATLNTMRSSLWQTSNLTATGIIGVGGCINPFLMSTINIITGNICMGSPIQLANPAAGNTASSWTWTAAGATPSLATTSSVSITYTTTGMKWVKLSVSNGTVTIKDSVLLAVTNCTLDPTKLNQAQWYFSQSCSVNFLSGSPVPQLPSSISSYESQASICDSTGNLLFYTDGNKVWNKNHAQMMNLGGYLYGYNYWNVSASNGAMIVPMPLNKKKYYIFSASQEPGNNPGDTTQRYIYSIIDMNMNGGLGDIASINQVVPGPYMLITEGQCAIPHCNGYDYWVISKGAKTTGYKDKLACYLVTAAGVSPPVISNAMFSVPTTTGTGTDPNEFQVAMEVSPDGKLVVVTENTNTGGPNNSWVRFYTFNNSTGVLTNVKNMMFVGAGPLLEPQFSPDSKQLYVCCGNDVNQIDVTNIATPVVTTVFNNVNKYYFQLGPDNKIYASCPIISNKLSVINFPNTPGVACSFSYATVSLLPTQSAFCLPTIIDAKKPAPSMPSYNVTQTNCSVTKFMVDSCWLAYTANWNFGDGTTGSGLVANHTYSTTGTFSTSLTLSIAGYTFPVVSQNVTVIQGTTSITGPSVICKGTPLLNSYAVSNIAGATYNWNIVNGVFTGPTNISNVNVGTLANGVATLSVQIVNGGCTTVATKTIVIDTIPNIIFTNSLTVCLGNTLTLNATPVGGTFSGTGVTGSIFNSTVTGLGTQTVNYAYTNPNGCYNMASKTITVSTCAGINELNGISGLINIYPNPNNGEFTVSIGKTGSNLEMEVYNYLGQIILTEDLTGQNTKINLNEKSNGIYFVRILENNKPIYNNKIIKE